MDNIYAERIAIEIKAGSTPREILRRFVIREEDNFDAIVFILASKRQSVIKETISSQKCRIYFIFKEDLVRNFIEKVVVYQAEKTDGKRKQAAEIFYNGVGAISQDS